MFRFLQYCHFINVLKLVLVCRVYILCFFIFVKFKNKLNANAFIFCGITYNVDEYI